MALVEIARRTIQEFGILDTSQVSDPIHGSRADWTRLEVWAVVRAIPTNMYANLEWNPDKSFYGRVTVSADNLLGATNPAIIKDIELRYEIQRIYEWQDYTRVTNFLINCATQKILVSIASANGSPTNPVINIIPLPTPTAIQSPIGIIRLNCYSDAVVDIVLLAENGLKLLTPNDDNVCTQFNPLVQPDETPSGALPENSNDADPTAPTGDAFPDAPYDPATRDSGETANDNIPPPLPGQRGRLVYSGMVSTCQVQTPYPINGASPTSYIAPITVAVVVRGNCNNGVPFKNIEVTDGAGTLFAYELTGLILVPTYRIEYFTP